MSDFEGLLATNYGFKPQGKSAPIAASKGSSAAGGGTVNFDLGSLGNQKHRDTDGVGDLFGGSASARYTSKSESRAADSPFNLDSIYRASDTSSKYTSAPPVFDKPLYDDDIFEGVPGLKSSAKVHYDDVFASVASKPEPRSDAFDDLLGGFGKVDRESKRSDGKRVDKDDNGVAGFEDLLPGFGGSRAPTGRPTSDPTMTPQASANSAKKMSDETDNPFKAFESTSVPQESSPAQFVDPLEEISRLSSSGSRKLDSSSVSNAKIYDDIDPFDGFGESVPAFSSERNNRKDRSPSRIDTGTAGIPTDKDSSEKSSIRSPERRSQSRNHVDHDHEFSQATFSMPAYSTNDNTCEESNVNVDIPPKYEGNFESDDDVWLVVSEIPLFTKPTAALPPSRNPPPRPLQVPKSAFGSAAYKNTRSKSTESPFSTSTQYSQAPQSAPVAARVPTASPFDELNDFPSGRSHGGDNELASGVDGEELEMNTVAAAMKEAMDRAEAKLRHAKGVREREGTKATKRENVQSEREKTFQEEREKQERLWMRKEREEMERLEKEREEKERLEKERGEKENEQRRLESERERARELERERARARQAVERATREARERAAVEARERAERTAVEKANAEARERAERAAVQRAQAEARERAAAEAKGRAEKAAAEAKARANTEARTENEARLRAERAAVERAAAEARERASAASAAKMNQQKSDNDLESFFSMGSRPSSAPKPRTNSSDSAFDNPFQNRQEPSVAKRSSEASSSIRKTSANFVDDLSSIFGAASSSGEFQEVEGETDDRRRARLDRHQRTQERAAKALAEKNERDLQTQREQAERHRIAETLDIEIKRWAAGKEGNLRALLSTLQYVLWPECGWQPVSLTDLITGASVKKVYRKATLCIHPDKVQQKGANLQQKYIAEKVFDLLKEAWNKFNSEELF